MMFFKKRIDGVDFGYHISEIIDEALLIIDKKMESRTGTKRGYLSELDGTFSALTGAGRLMTTTLSQREFGLIWILAFKELVLVSTDDRNAYKINHGFHAYIKEHYGEDEAYIQQIHIKIKNIIDSDYTFSRTGMLQDYDNNMNRNFHERQGISYEMARLTVTESLLAEDVKPENKELIASGLMVEFEELFNALAGIYRKFKIT